MAAFDPAQDTRVVREPAVYLVGRQVVEPAQLGLTEKILLLLKQEAAYIFGDDQLVPLPDGTSEPVTPHRKV